MKTYRIKNISTGKYFAQRMSEGTDRARVVWVGKEEAGEYNESEAYLTAGELLNRDSSLRLKIK